MMVESVPAAEAWVCTMLFSRMLLPRAKRSSAIDLQSQQWPRAGLTQVRFVNNHLVYALTWYGLALMVAGATWLVLRKRKRVR